MSMYVKRELFDEMKRLFDESWDANEEAQELLVQVWRSLDKGDVRRLPLEYYFRKVGAYIDGKVFK